MVRLKYFGNLPDSAIINSGLAIILGSVIVIITAIVFTRHWFKNVTVYLFHKTPNENIWRDVFDFKRGSNLKLYLKNEDYYLIGHFRNIEEKEADPWIAISAFSKHDKITNLNYNNEPDFSDNADVILTVRLSDVEHIEIF